MTQITAHTEANRRSPCSKGTALLFSRKSLFANLHFLTVYMTYSLASNNPRVLIQRQLPIYFELDRMFHWNKTRSLVPVQAVLHKRKMPQRSWYVLHAYIPRIWIQHYHKDDSVTAMSRGHVTGLEQGKVCDGSAVCPCSRCVLTPC
jgi:hypothetical protein